MKKYKKRIRQLHKNSLRFVFGTISVYYLIQMILHLALKDGIVFPNGMAFGGLNYSDSSEKSKYLVKDFYSVFVDNGGMQFLYLRIDDDQTTVLLSRSRKDCLCSILQHVESIFWIEIILPSWILTNVLEPSYDS